MTEDEMIEEATQRALLCPISNVFEFDVDLYLGLIRGEQMNEECAICAEDYHDSDQYICDDCHKELEALKADQLASRYD